MKKLMPILFAIPPVSFIILMKWNAALYIFIDAAPILIMFPVLGAIFILWLLLIAIKYLLKII